jgi:hypothetical protein
MAPSSSRLLDYMSQKAAHKSLLSELKLLLKPLLRDEFLSKSPYLPCPIVKAYFTQLDHHKEAQ